MTRGGRHFARCGRACTLIAAATALATVLGAAAAPGVRAQETSAAPAPAAAEATEAAATEAAATEAAAADTRAAAPPAAAAPPLAAEADLAISLEAATSEIDRRNDQLVFTDVEVTQGELGIRAARAVGTGLSFESSDWTFSDTVELRSAGALIEADEAVLSFRDHRLVRARLTGSPVAFERASTRVPGQVARGRAARVDYDVVTGSVRLSGDAWLCEGNNEITSDSIVYDIAAERVLAESAEGEDGRVRIRITPSSSTSESRPEDGDDRECGAPDAPATPAGPPGDDADGDDADGDGAEGRRGNGANGAAP